MNQNDRVLIVGGNSDIGKAIASIYREAGHEISVTTRKPEEVLSEQVIHLDLGMPSTYRNLGTRMWERVYYCVGTSEGSAEHIFRVNAMDAVAVLDKLALRTEAGGKLALLTTHLSSPTFLNGSSAFAPAAAKNLSYVMSRAAFNVGAVVSSKVNTHCKWVLLHPGYVSTKATKYTKAPNAVSPEVSARGVVSVVENVDMMGPLEFWDYRGYKLEF